MQLRVIKNATKCLGGGYLPGKTACNSMELSSTPVTRCHASWAFVHRKGPLESGWGCGMVLFDSEFRGTQSIASGHYISYEGRSR